MKKLTYWILIILAFLMLLKIGINKYYYTDTFLWPSRSYVDALNNHALVAEYQIKQIDSRVIDSLKKYNYLKKTINNRYWIEKQSREFPKYLFFKKRIFSEDNYIRYNDLIICKCEDWRRWLSDTAKVPMIILSLEDTLTRNEVRRKDFYYKNTESQLLPYQITLHVYFKRPKDNTHQSYINNVTDIANDDLTTEYLGKIILTELKNPIIYKDKTTSSIWKSFNFIPENSMKKDPCYLGDIVKDTNDK